MYTTVCFSDWCDDALLLQQVKFFLQLPIREGYNTWRFHTKWDCIFPKPDVELLPFHHSYLAIKHCGILFHDILCCSQPCFIGPRGGHLYRWGFIWWWVVAGKNSQSLGCFPWYDIPGRKCRLSLYSHCSKQKVTCMHPRGVMLWPSTDLGTTADSSRLLRW